MLEVGQRGFACTHINIYLLMFNANTINSSELDNISTSKKKKCDFELNWLLHRSERINKNKTMTRHI